MNTETHDSGFGQARDRLLSFVSATRCRAPPSVVISCRPSGTSIAISGLIATSGRSAAVTIFRDGDGRHLGQRNGRRRAPRLVPDWADLWRCWWPEGAGTRSPPRGGLDIASQERTQAGGSRAWPEAGIVVSVFNDAEVRQVEAGQAVSARRCGSAYRTVCHAFHEGAKGAANRGKEPRRSCPEPCNRHPARGESPSRLRLGHAVQRGSALTTSTSSRSPGAGGTGCTSGHAIVSRAVFVGGMPSGRAKN